MNEPMNTPDSNDNSIIPDIHRPSEPEIPFPEEGYDVYSDKDLFVDEDIDNPDLIPDDIFDLDGNEYDEEKLNETYDDNVISPVYTNVQTGKDSKSIDPEFSESPNDYEDPEVDLENTLTNIPFEDIVNSEEYEDEDNIGYIDPKIIDNTDPIHITLDEIDKEPPDFENEIQTGDYEAKDYSDYDDNGTTFLKPNEGTFPSEEDNIIKSIEEEYPVHVGNNEVNTINKDLETTPIDEENSIKSKNDKSWIFVKLKELFGMEDDNIFELNEPTNQSDLFLYDPELYEDNYIAPSEIAPNYYDNEIDTEEINDDKNDLEKTLESENEIIRHIQDGGEYGGGEDVALIDTDTNFVEKEEDYDRSLDTNITDVGDKDINIGDYDTGENIVDDYNEVYITLINPDEKIDDANETDKNFTIGGHVEGELDENYLTEDNLPSDNNETFGTEVLVNEIEPLDEDTLYKTSKESDEYGPILATAFPTLSGSKNLPPISSKV